MAISKSGLLFDFKSAGNVTTSGAQAVGQAIAAGEVIVVSASGSGTSGVTTGISDSKGNTWTGLTQVYQATTGGGWVRLFYCVVTVALTAADTITVTRTSGSLCTSARVLSGVDGSSPLDGAQVSGTGNSGTPATSAASLLDGSLIFGHAEMAAAMAGFSAVAAGFTKESDGVSTSTNARAYGTLSQIKSGAGSVTPSATATGGAGLWAMVAQAFRAVASAAPTGTITLSGSTTVVEVEVVAPTGNVTLSGSTTVVEVEVVASTGTITLSGSSIGREVEVTAAAGTLTLSGSAVAREVVSVSSTGTIILVGIASSAVITPTVTVLIEVGAWSQTWDLGEPLDDADIAMIAADGAVLDGLTASWQAPTMLDQPDPAVLSFSVYVPAGAAGPNLEQGSAVHVLVTPPLFDDAGPEIDPLFDYYGRVSDGEATPRRDGLVYAVSAVDTLAELGEVTLGIGDYVGSEVVGPYTFDDAADRVTRLTDELAGLDVTLQHPWHDKILDPMPDVPGVGGDWTDFLAWEVRRMPLTATGENTYYPYYPGRKAGGIPGNEMLHQITEPGCRWTYPHPYVTQDFRDFGEFDLYARYATPASTGWYRTWLQPYLCAGVDDDDQALIRVLWSTPRVEGNAGLPLVVDTTDGLALRAKALDGEIPDTTRDGCWIPAGAVPRDSIVWRVDKGARPNKVTLAGFWLDLSDPDGSAFDWRWWVDRSWSVPERIKAGGPVEEQLDTSYLTPDGFDTAQAATVQLWNFGDWIGQTHLGFWSDSVPRYLVDGIEIRCSAIPDPDQWPRLFADPHRDGYAGGPLGRFVFVYDVADKWNPRGQGHYFGQLIGAGIEISAGQVRLSASLAQRRPGPNGPIGTLPAVTDADSLFDNLLQRARGEDPTPALKWTDTPVGSPIGDLTPLDTDPTITALDLWLTTAD